MAATLLIVFVVILTIFGSTEAVQNEIPVAIEVEKSDEFQRRICHENETCLFGYVFVDPVYKTASFRVLQTWYINIYKTFLSKKLLRPKFSFVTRCRCSNSKFCAYKYRTSAGIYNYYCKTENP